LQSGDRVCLIVNNLGACTDLEISIIARDTLLLLRDKGIIVERIVEGRILTSLEMHGMSLTILKIRHESDIGNIDYTVDCKHFKATKPIYSFTQTNN